MTEYSEQSTAVSRRSALKGLAAGASVLVAGNLGTGAVFAQASSSVPINAWIAIAPNGRVTLQCAHSEMGQGIVTTFGAIIADELEADWAKCDVVFSPAAAAYRHPVYDWQFTGNAESIRTYHALIRKMGAAAREMLIAAAADRLKVPATQLTARNGVVRHAVSGRSLGYGQLIAAAVQKSVPSEPKVKPQMDWRLVGNGRSLPRRDVPAKVTGAAEFGIDVKVPGMLHAALESAPTIGGKIATVDDAAAKAMPGVRAVVPLGAAVAVVADHYWQARLALEKLKVTWAAGPGGAFDDGALRALYDKAFAGTSGWAEAEKHGDAPAALTGTVIEQTYESQWLSHAPMEPMNATVSITDAGIEAWVPTQGMQMTEVVLSSVLKVPADKIKINRTYLGGGFGRRLLADFALQAAFCSKAVGKPVKLIWSREEDTKLDYFRPGFISRTRAKVGADGMPEAIHHRLVAPTILSPVNPTPILPGTVDNLCVEGFVEQPYKIPNYRVDYHMLEVPVPTMVLRTTGHGPNNFASESLIDELAIAAKQNPYEYRRKLLAHNAVALAVLDKAASLANWGKAGQGRFQGIAFADGFGAYLCQIIELSLVDGALKLHKVTSVCDPGRVLDRINATSMIEGGVVWGLTAALYSKINFTKGHVREANFDGYRVATLPDTPELVTAFLESRPAIGGLGEVGPICVPAALCNAIFSSTGVRHRRLPLADAKVFTVYGKTYG